MREFITAQIEKSINIKQDILNNQSLLEMIENVSKEAIETYNRGNKILIAGNGGSAADAQHIAAEFVSRFYFDRPGLPAIALTTDSSILTAIGNDYGFENLFARQIQANGIKGDMLIAISTSGNSPNIIKAIEKAKKIGIATVGLTGSKPCKMDEMCDFCIKIPSPETPRIQESHIMIGHIICSIVEKEIFGSETNIINNIQSVIKKFISE